MEKTRVAVIGCGAVTELFHLPALVAAPSVEVTVLVDPQRTRAEALAGRFGVAEVSEDYRTMRGEVDAALLALPNHLHASIAIDLLNGGRHVLVEKPMARTTGECDAMVRAAAAAAKVLSVALVKRFFPSSRFVRQALQSGLLGAIRSLDWREGRPYRWPIATDFPFRKEASGGGVLIDVGGHVLDLMLWWLGDGAVVEYVDDAGGGVEADCELRLRFGEVEATVELSRTRTLRNSCIITGSRGTLEIEVDYDSAARLTLTGPEGASLPGKLEVGTEGSRISGGWAVHRAFSEQFESFAAATRGDPGASATGEDGARVVSLVEACYAVRQPLLKPWLSVPPLREAV